MTDHRVGGYKGQVPRPQIWHMDCDLFVCWRSVSSAFGRAVLEGAVFGGFKAKQKEGRQFGGPLEKDTHFNFVLRWKPFRAASG